MPTPAKAYTDPTAFIRPSLKPLLPIDYGWRPPTPLVGMPMNPILVETSYTRIIPIAVFLAAATKAHAHYPKIPTPPLGRQIIMTFPAIYKERAITPEKSPIRALDRTTKISEDLRNPSWRSETGYPSKVMTLDGDQMQLCPPMAGITPVIGVLEAPVDLDLAIPTGTPDVRIPVPHHPHLCVGALYLLLSKDASKGDVSKANKALQDFIQLIGVADGGGKH